MIGLINIQFAVYGDEELYVIEANPRASRTVPFVSKAIGVPLAKIACRLMLGERLADLRLDIPRAPRHVSVKEAVLPFGRFPRADALLGPEMKSTGEVMGVAARLPDRVRQGPGRRRARSCRASGSVFISVTDGDKPAATQLAAAAPRPGLPRARHRRHRAGDPPHGRAGRADQRSSPRARRTWSTGSSRARWTW